MARSGADAILAFFSMFAPQTPDSKSSPEPSPKSGFQGLDSAAQRSIQRLPSDQTLQLYLATIADLDHLIELDRLCFDTLWSRETYTRELDSPNSDILLLKPLLNPPFEPRLQPGLQPETQAISNHPAGSPKTDPPAMNHPNPIPPALGYGCVWAILDEAHITILGVHPQHRRQGFGDVLMSGLLWAAYQRGLTRATLEVSTQNRAAIELYEKMGFQRAGCRKGYYANGDDAAILWKSGLQHPNFQQDITTWMGHHREKMERLGWSLTECLWC